MLCKYIEQNCLFWILPKHFALCSWEWATSLLVSTSVWESLPLADFFLCFSTWASGAHDQKEIFLTIFGQYSNIFLFFRPWVHWSKYTTSIRVIILSWLHYLLRPTSQISVFQNLWNNPTINLVGLGLTYNLSLICGLECAQRKSLNRNIT